MEGPRLETARRRQGWLLLFFLVFGARLAWSLVDIQVISHDAYVEAAQRQQKTRHVIPPARGRVFDRNGVALAVNREQYAIYLVPRHIEDVDRFVDRFTGILDWDVSDLRAKIARGGWYVRLARGVSRDVVKRLEKADIAGVGVETYEVRHYPHGELARSVLGDVDVDNVGIEGIELQLDETLRGEPGYAIHQRDALGREYPNFTLPVQPPVDGHDVWLTIDVRMQEIVEAAMDAAMERTRAKRGSIVVVDPRTGEIVAMADRVAEDGEIEATVRNHAVVDQFEPGSTFKIVTLTGLYEEALAAPTDSIFCENGRWDTGRRVLTDVHPYEWLTVQEVIEESSNICAAKLAFRLGPERIYEYARKYGFGLPSGLDFPGEPRGLLKRPDRWSSLTEASVAMGYEVMVTGVQMAMAYAAIANGGELLRPYLVGKVTDPEGETEYEGTPQRVRRVMRPETARRITEALVEVVEGGTARSAQIDVLPVAGKTGTARKTGEHGYVRGRYTSSFAGFFPAFEARYVVFVRIDEPVGAFYGGAVAAPVFREAMEGSLVTETLSGSPTLVERMRSPERVLLTVSDGFPEMPAWPADSGAAGPAGPADEPVVPADSSEIAWRSIAEPPAAPREDAPYVVDVSAGASVPDPPLDPRTQVKVPDFTDLSLREAVRRASTLGLRLAFEGTGRVRGQWPEAGEIVERGASIRIQNP